MITREQMIDYLQELQDTKKFPIAKRSTDVMLTAIRSALLAQDDIRNKALEEAAMEIVKLTGVECDASDAIRALKSKPEREKS